MDVLLEGEIAERYDWLSNQSEMTLDELFARFFHDSNSDSIIMDAYTNNLKLNFFESQFQGQNLDLRKRMTLMVSLVF